MISYEVFENLIVLLSIFFLIIDLLFKKRKVYGYLKGKLTAKYALNPGLYNLNYIYPYKKTLDVLNHVIQNIFIPIKISIILAILYFVMYGTLKMFILPIVLIISVAVIIVISKKFAFKQYINLESTIALENYQPCFVFYFSAPSKSFSYHIKMWFPYLKLLNLKFYIMVREKEHVAELLNFVEDTPIVFAGSLGNMEKYLPTSVQMAFYANNGTKNTHLVRFNHLLHIQLLHGDSEKPPSFNPVSKMYDKLFVSGQRAIDRYAENNVIIHKDSFEIVGRPQISNIKLIEKHKKSESTLTVLFAPTWVGFHEDTKFSSLFYIYDVIKYLIESKLKVKIILRLHPLTDRSDKKTSEYLKKIEALLNKDRDILYSDRDIIDDFNESDCIVTDTSSVPIDFLYSEKPIIHIDVNGLSDYYKTDKRYEQYSTCVYMIDSKYRNVDEVFNSVFNNDILLEKRKIVKSYYHGSFDQPLEEVFVATVKRLYAQQKNSSKV